MRAYFLKKLCYHIYSEVIALNKDVIYIRVDEELKKKLDMVALEEQRSLNNLVVLILTKYIEEREQKKNTKN